MENTTKALLIAAGILIVIVIISLSILLLKNTNSTGGQVDKVGKEISDATDIGINKFQKNFISKEEFNDFIDYFQKEGTRNSNEFANIALARNEKLRKQIEIIGYIYYGNKQYPALSGYRSKKIEDKGTKSWEEYEKYWIDTVIPTMLRDRVIESLPGGWYSHRPYYLKAYAIKNNIITNSNDWNSLDTTQKNKIENDFDKDSSVSRWANWFWNYDNDGYIDKVGYVVYLKYN